VLRKSLRLRATSSRTSASVLLKPAGVRADLVCIVTSKPDFPWRRLGELLIERDLIDERALEDALDVQADRGGRLGEVLVSRGALKASDLITALAEQHGLDVRVERRETDTSEPTPVSPPWWQPLGQILVERGSLGRDALRAAIDEQRRTGHRLGSILVDQGHVSADEVVEALVQQHGLEPHALVAAATAEPDSGPAYEVAGPDGDALFRTAGFLDATDFAFELLDADRPARLDIFRIHGSEREHVWSYTDERAAEAAAAPRDALGIYGFDVTRWTGPTRR
jgi:hypothetical protein